MKENMKKEKGITLIALVITIIILLILVGVVIGIVFNGGLINNAQLSAKMTNVESIREKLEAEKAELAVEKEGKLDIKEYIERLEKKGITSEEEVIENNEESYDVTVEGHVFLVEKEENGNIKIEYIGEAGNLLPKIVIEQIRGTSDSLTVKYKIKYAEKYKLYIRKEEESSYEEKEGNKIEKEEIESTIEGLEHNKTYVIKIEAEREDGEKSEKEVRGTTIIDLSKTDAKFTYEPEGWTNDKVTATIEVDEEILNKGYEIETSIDGEHWEKTNSQTREENGKVYARLVDSLGQEGGSIEGNIDKIDKEDPGEADIVISGDTIQAQVPISLQAKVTHKDTKSGVDIKSCKYELNNSGEELGKEANKYTGEFSENGQSIEVNPNSINSWYIHVLTVDEAGNPKETIKGPITVTENTHKHIGDSINGGECYGELHTHDTTTCYTTATCTIYATGIANAWSDQPCSCGSTTFENTANVKHSICGTTGTMNIGRWCHGSNCGNNWRKWSTTHQVSQLTCQNKYNLTCTIPEEGYLVKY